MDCQVVNQFVSSKSTKKPGCSKVERYKIESDKKYIHKDLTLNIDARDISIKINVRYFQTVRGNEL